MVSVTLAEDEAPLPVALRLYLSKEWTDDRERCRKVGVPDDIPFRTKWQVALDEIDRIVRRKVRFGVVLADAGYGVWDAPRSVDTFAMRPAASRVT